MQHRQKILIIAPFVTFPNELGSGTRFVAIAQMLATRADVTLVTSRFHHFTKSQRSSVPNIPGVDVVLLDQPAYKRNVGVGRVYSQLVFCRHLQSYLDKGVEAHVIYSAYPLIRSNLILVKLKQHHSFKYIVDVQDVWPESISGALPLARSFFGKWLLEPLTRQANLVYRSADAIVAVSQTYAKRANVRNLGPDRCVVAYLGTDKMIYKDRTNTNKPKDEKVSALYLGTIGSSYDIDTLVRAAPLVKNVDIKVVGDGPDMQKMKNLNDSLGGHVQFLGPMPYDKVVECMLQSHIALNPIKGSAEQSITNKLSDYMSAGLPIVSSQENQEVKTLLERGGGVYYKAGDSAKLAQLLTELACDEHRRNTMCAINCEIAEELFYRPEAYKKIDQLIETIINLDYS